MYVASRNTNSVKHYDAATGAYLGDFVASGSDGLDQPVGLLFVTPPPTGQCCYDRDMANPSCADEMTPAECAALPGFSLFKLGEDCIGDCTSICDTECQGVGVAVVNSQMTDAGWGAAPRFLSFVVEGPRESRAVRVTFPDPMPSPYQEWSGLQMWVGPPERFCENSGIAAAPGNDAPNFGCAAAPGLSQRVYFAATLQCDPFFMDWNGLGQPIYVYHEGIIPSTGPHNGPAITPTTYVIQTVSNTCLSCDWPTNVDPLPMATSKWGDTVENTASSPYPPPEGLVGIVDVLAQLAKFQNTNLASVSARVDLLGSEAPNYLPDHKVTIGDVVQGLFAFQAVKYPSPAINGVPNLRPCE